MSQSDNQEDTMGTITPPDLHPIYGSIEEAISGLSALDDAIEEAFQAALGVELTEDTWDDSGDDTEPFERMKSRLAEARIALSAARGELAYVEGMRALRGTG